MALTLHFHPLSSFCMKALIGLYELEIPFEKNVVHLEKEDERDALSKLWPMGRFPVLSDDARGAVVAESSIIIESVDRDRRLIPGDRERALLCRMRDRIFDLDVGGPMQKLVGDRLRPENKRDSLGVEDAKIKLRRAYALIDDWMREGPWAIGETFSMADCAAAPSLFFAGKMVPFDDKKHLTEYFARLEKRPSFARALEEAKPYFALFPG